MKIRKLPKTESPRKQLENEEYHANYQGPGTRKLEFHLKKKIQISSKAEKLIRLFLLLLFFFFFFNYKGFCVMFIQG